MTVYRSIGRVPRACRARLLTSLLGIAGAMLLLPAVGVRSAHGEENKTDAPTWQGVLALQLKDEHRCDLDKVLFDRDIDAGGRLSKEGRVRCLDGREFDFSRPSTHETFDIRLCQPTVC